MTTIHQRAWRLGLLAVVAIILGSGWYQAWVVSPYRLTDEQAHIGYVLDLQRGVLPEIESPIPAEDGGPLLQERIDITGDRYGEVWVANNPPVAYLLFVPPAAITRALGFPGGPLMGVRLANLACFGVAVALVAQLGRRLGGDDPRIGLVAAGIVAAVPHVGVVAGAAFIEGPALLAAVGLFDAVTRIAQRRPTRRELVILSAWCAFAAGIRPMTAVLAAVAAALALAIVAYRWWRGRAGRRVEGPSPTTVSPWWAMAVVVLPTLVLDGWFYVRNLAIYGDPTGSTVLLEKFDRVARTSSLRALVTPEAWTEPVRTLLNRKVTHDTPDAPISWWVATKWGLVLLVGAAIVLIVVDQLRRSPLPRWMRSPEPAPALAWSAMGVCAFTAVLVTAQHWAGGGTIHPRYLLPALVLVAALVAISIVRLGTEWAGLGLVLLLTALNIHQTPAQNRYYTATKMAKTLASPLTDSIGPLWLRMLGFALMGLGVVGLATSLFLLRRPAEATA